MPNIENKEKFSLEKRLQQRYPELTEGMNEIIRTAENAEDLYLLGFLFSGLTSHIAWHMQNDYDIKTDQAREMLRDFNNAALASFEATILGVASPISETVH